MEPKDWIMLLGGPTLTFAVLLLGILLNGRAFGTLENNLRTLEGNLRDRHNDLRDALRTEMALTRDALRAEMARNHSELLHRFADLDARLTRIEAERE